MNGERKNCHIWNHVPDFSVPDYSGCTDITVCLIPPLQVWDAVCLSLLKEGLREQTCSGSSAVPPAIIVHQPSPEWARITPVLVLHSRCLFFFFGGSPLSSSPQRRMNDCTLGGWGVMDGDSWEHCLQNTTGTCVCQRILTCTFY